MNGKVKAILLLGVMFGLGVVSEIAWQRYRLHQFPVSRSLFAAHRVERLKKQLDLTPEQENALRQIFQTAHERAMQINEEVSWDLADIHKDTVKAINAVLTLQQREKFEKLHQKFHENHRHFPTDEDDGTPGPPPPPKP